MKKLFKLFIVAMTAFSLSACSKGSSDNKDIVTTIDKDVEVIFWHAMNGTQEEVLTALTKQFMSENPKIKVTLQNQSSYSDMQAKLTMTLSSPTNLPTITQAYPGWMIDAESDKLLVSLDDYIKHSEIGFDNYDDLLPAFKNDGVINGSTYGLPFNKSTEVIFYNETILKEVGVSVPKTLEELVTVSKEIYAKKGIPGVGWDSLSNFFVTYLEFKGQHFDSSFDVTSDVAKEAVNYYLDGIKGGYFRTAGTDKYMSGPFGAQQVAMYIGSNAGESYVTKGAEGKFTYGVARYPSTTAMQQGTDIFMFTNSTAEQRTAAWMYLKYLTNASSQLEWSTKTGYIPVRSSVATSTDYINSGSKVAAASADINKDLFALKNERGSNQAYNQISTVLEKILSDKNSDVSKELDAFKTELKTIYE